MVSALINLRHLDTWVSVHVSTVWKKKQLRSVPRWVDSTANTSSLSYANLNGTYHGLQFKKKDSIKA